MKDETPDQGTLKSRYQESERWEQLCWQEKWSQAFSSFILPPHHVIFGSPPALSPSLAGFHASAATRLPISFVR
jgi:hypothetical protein